MSVLIKCGVDGCTTVHTSYCESPDEILDELVKLGWRQDSEKWSCSRHLKKIDMINHPSHYGGADNPYEAIKVIEAWGLGFCLGNTVKYIARAPHKENTVEDLKKAAWYLNRAIERLEKAKQ